ncbi:hypothetical protein U2F26_07870 [Micromonospora sp. 4G57]|uniref:Lipid/polyisoprenoid-binding YceI-like domain-containing protein n=1 Tax=Micromonospora sicca TaxID=2202420 RepID=A0ABU5J859_9ACTN|nr:MULTISPECIES: hypothetical protein [unclassified Micromonospora]MDZ5442647.1 hypothetical protein [Micromonospora sp. 4G57]MDZ5488772.1 hypothetical protein [Micromonospora sp. 4G53]
MPGQSEPRLFAALLGLLGLSAAVALAAPEPARACAPAGSARAVTAAPEPSAPDTGCATPPPSSGGGGVGRMWPWLAADPTQPLAAGSRWKLTGSAVTMTGLRLDGIVDLPTAEGSLRALKFTMDQAVVDDFLLRSTGPADRTTLFAADRMTLQGKVALYTTRFAGRMVGIDIILTPDLPLPDGIPATPPSPITFTDTAVDLAFVGSDALTAGPTLRVAID